MTREATAAARCLACTAVKNATISAIQITRAWLSAPGQIATARVTASTPTG